MAGLKRKVKLNPPVVVDRKQINTLLTRIAAIQANVVPFISDEVLARLLGAEQALLSVSNRSNYLAAWLSKAETDIIEAHKTFPVNSQDSARPTGCGCGVCKRA